MTETDLQAPEPAIADETPVDQTEGDAAPAPAVAEADDSSARPKQDGLQKRFDKLTWEKHELARERDWLRQQIAQRNTPTTSDTAAPEAPKPPPKLADFNYDEDAYQKALVEHVKGETARQVREDLRKEQAEQAKRQKAETFSSRERAFASKHSDYLELTRDSSLPITQTMVDLVQDAEAGPDVLYYLANNRDEAARIAQMDEKSAARAIGRIEAKLETPAPPPPPPKPVSKAPPPPPQIETSESAVRISTTSPDSDKLSDDEWVRAERKRLARKVKSNA